MRHRPLIPMGAITGKPSREELRQMLESYRQAGIDQFLIYPRSGLEVEYMGEEWLEICRHIIEFCAEHDMAVWLYDEYNWPSGNCKGKVVGRDPAFAAQKLVAFSAIERLRPGYFWTKVSIPIYVDVLNPAAVDCFIELTHETYHRRFGKYFGSTIKGVFTDEPSFMYLMQRPVVGAALELPCYDSLEEDYLQAAGSGLLPDLELHLAGDTPPRLWRNYHALMGKRFRQAYLERIRGWCDQHGVLSTGHLMDELDLRKAITCNGNPVAAIQAFSMPGMDEIYTHARFEDIEWCTLKLLESAMNGPRTEALAELFALGPSDMTLATMRMMIHVAALHGVNHFVTAVSALDARGNVEKPVYYNPVAPTQPWFPHIGALNEDAAAAAELARRKATASVALRYPQRLADANWNDKLELTIDFTELLRSLVDRQWEFRLVGDDETPEPHYAVVLAMNADGVRDERSGTQFPDIPALLAFLERSLTRRACLRDKDGKLVGRILLKSFDDGSVCVVNTSEEQLREVTLGDDFFDLPPRSVASFPRPATKFGKTLDLNERRFSCRITGVNTRRCIFTDNQEVTVETETAVKVIFALRRYGGDAALTLDGAELEAVAPCAFLPVGLKSLYRETAPLTLAPGKHVLRLTNGAKDLPYLPLAFVAGDFALGADKVLRPSPREAKIGDFFASALREYVGTAVFSGEVDLGGHESLAVEHEGMVVELLLDGRSLGPRLWAPFVWEIPPELRRKAKVELRVATSVGPLFADYPLHVADAGWLAKYWPGKPG